MNCSDSRIQKSVQSSISSSTAHATQIMHGIGA